jgi:hypothetical protein
LKVNGLIFSSKCTLLSSSRQSGFLKILLLFIFSSFFNSYFLSLCLRFSVSLLLLFSVSLVDLSVSLFIYLFLFFGFSIAVFLCFFAFASLFVCLSVCLLLCYNISINFFYLSLSLHSFFLPQVQGRFDCILLWLFIGWLTRETVKYKKEEKHIFTQAFIFPVIQNVLQIICRI